MTQELGTMVLEEDNSPKNERLVKALEEKLSPKLLQLFDSEEKKAAYLDLRYIVAGEVIMGERAKRVQERVRAFNSSSGHFDRLNQQYIEQLAEDIASGTGLDKPVAHAFAESDLFNIRAAVAEYSQGRSGGKGAV